MEEIKNKIISQTMVVFLPASNDTFTSSCGDCRFSFPDTDVSFAFPVSNVMKELMN
jgi:hypothetical protein